MTTKTRVTKAQAAKVVAAIHKAFPGYREYPPKVMRDFDGQDCVIVWEEGPFEWTYIFPHGGINLEATMEIQEFSPGARIENKDVSDLLPEGIRIEPATHYSISVYREN